MPAVCPAAELPVAVGMHKCPKHEGLDASFRLTDRTHALSDRVRESCGPSGAHHARTPSPGFFVQPCCPFSTSTTWYMLVAGNRFVRASDRRRIAPQQPPSFVAYCRQPEEGSNHDTSLSDGETQ